MLKLKLQYFGHLMQTTDSLEKTLMLGKIENRKRKGWQMKRWLVGIIYLVDMSLRKVQVFVNEREVWHAAVHGVAKSQTWLSIWTEQNKPNICEWDHCFLNIFHITCVNNQSVIALL